MDTRYREILYDMAYDMGCGLRLEPNLPGMMYVEFGYVEGPDPVTSTTYTPQQAFAVGLHELGHFAYDHTQGRPPRGDITHYFDNGVLRSEATAWAYAFARFDDLGIEIEEDVLRYSWNTCLGSYVRGAKIAGDSPTRLWNGNRHHVEFVYDKLVDDHPLWAVKGRMLGKEVAFAGSAG